ncbi:MAG TPA: nuclear transport factor 2 family protein [Steroidobacteraceae bacterium]|nr:nuclear transport factor 2 family protein [Steroidobacteraceae bacterium]
MKTRRTTLAAALVAVASLLSVASPAKDDGTRAAALRAAEVARFAANVDADAAALDKLLDAGLEYAHSNGKFDGKESFIRSLSDGSIDYLAMTPEIQSLRVFGDVGVIRGEARVKVAIGGQSHEFTLGFSDVWLWKDGRWQMTAWRSTRLPDAPAK